MNQSTKPKIILDGLRFFNSHWTFYGGNVEIINCHTTSLVLEHIHLTYAIIQNCTFGNWTFRRVQNAFIKNCNNIFDEYVSTSLNLHNSSAIIENMIIEQRNLTGDIDGIIFCKYSSLHIGQSKFVNNTVKQGIIQMLKLSALTMSNCTVLNNHAIEYPGAIYASESFVHVKNTYFHGNTAIYAGGAILITNISFLQIKNCTFTKNQVHGALGFGGAIFSLNNSVLDLSHSIFDGNKAHQGGAICQQTSVTILNQCSFLGNSEAAMSGLDNSEISITNSIFQNNLANYQGGTLIIKGSILNVSNTSFEKNVQISASHKAMFQPVITKEGGGAIYLSKSLGNISNSWLHNNFASNCGGSVYAVNSSLSIKHTKFENNIAGMFGGTVTSVNCFMNIEYSKFQNHSVLNEVIGQGGVLYLLFNSTREISHTLLSNCHANSGGAITANSTKIIMSNTSVIANTGSAEDLIDGNTFKINNSKFINNSAPLDGGAIR